MKYTSVDIIYNPNSTGPSRDIAADLKNNLKDKFPEAKVNLQATKYAGHAVEIAYECAKSSKRPLIVSSSGDGGYNEVINGAMKAQLEGASPTCAVLPAGNANDHSRTLHDIPLFESISKGHETKLDLLKATFSKGGSKHIHYAHSYIGLGLTPVVAVELNKTSLNALKELWIVLKTFYKFRPFKLKRNGKVMVLDSIIFTNIGQMAKVLTVAKNAQPDDGLFEVVTFPHSHKARLVKKLAKAAVSSLEPTRHYTHYDFEVLKRMPAQFDGEVHFIDRSSKVRITAEKQVLRTVI